MTNKEQFKNLTLADALARFHADCDMGLAETFEGWLEGEYNNPAEHGRLVRGKWYTEAAIECKIVEMEIPKVTGYLLEFKQEGARDFSPSEFATACRTNRYDDCFDGKAEQEDWWQDEVFVGYFESLPKYVWLDDGDTWLERCGVDFSPDTTPKEKPNPEGVWEGDCEGGCFIHPTKWRVRKIEIEGTLSDKARAYYRKHPNIWMRHDWI